MICAELNELESKSDIFAQNGLESEIRQTEYEKNSLDEFPQLTTQTNRRKGFEEMICVELELYIFTSFFVSLKVLEGKDEICSIWESLYGQWKVILIWEESLRPLGKFSSIWNVIIDITWNTIFLIISIFTLITFLPSPSTLIFIEDKHFGGKLVTTRSGENRTNKFDN